MAHFNKYECNIKLLKEPTFDEVCYHICDIIKKDYIIDKVGNLKYYMSPVLCNMDTIEDTKRWYTFMMFDTASNDYINVTCIYYKMQGLLDIRMEYHHVEGENS